MVDYSRDGSCRWFGRVQRCNLLAYWEFLALLAMRLGKFPIAMVFSACKYPHGCKRSHSLHLQPRFFGGCIIRPCGLTCLSPAHRLWADWDKGLPHCSRSSPYTHYSVWTCRKGVLEPCLQMLTVVRPAVSLSSETADLGIASQYALCLCEIGNGVQDDITLRGQSGVLRIVLTRMERNER